MDTIYLGLASLAAANTFTQKNVFSNENEFNADQHLDGDALLWRFRDTGGSGVEWGLRSDGGNFEICENTGTEGTPVWTVRMTLSSSAITGSSFDLALMRIAYTNWNHNPIVEGLAPGRLTGIAYGNTTNRWIICGSSKIYHSKNGDSHWTEASNYGGMVEFNQIIWGEAASLYVTCGNYGVMGYSSYGDTWTSGGNSGDWMNELAYDGGTFVSVGLNERIVESTTGTSWTSRRTGSNDLIDVTYGNSLFVAVGAAGTILTSPDGITWTARTSGTASALNGILWTGTKFLVTGTSGIIRESTDGIIWTTGTATPNVIQAWDIKGSTIVGIYKNILVYDIVVSTDDGVTWNNLGSIFSCGTYYAINAIAADPTRNRFLGPGGNATGTEGFLLSSLTLSD